MTTTKRSCSPGAEEWLGVVQPVLNGGEIELVDYLSSEEQMVGIARISHGKILPHSSDEQAQRLINYFMENKHTSPFEFIELTWRWRLPIFVARQVIRHRTANVNEQSARYSELSADLYIPEPNRVQGQDKKNKQGSSGELPQDVRLDFIEALKQIEQMGRFTYKSFLDDGIAKELARVHLPVGVYTNWVWKMDLHNLFHFLGLRLDSHAQYEVRVYAEAMARVIKEAYPMCWKAFEEYKLYAKTLSATEVGVLRAFMQNHMDGGTWPINQELLKKVYDKIYPRTVSQVMTTPGEGSVKESSSNPTTSN